jgi:hypothetical protein
LNRLRRVLSSRWGELIVAAVADEASGMENAVNSIEDWMTDASRFSIGWIQAVRSLIAKARKRSIKGCKNDTRPQEFHEICSILLYKTMLDKRLGAFRCFFLSCALSLKEG